MGEAPLLGNVQPRSSARNFAIYERARAPGSCPQPARQPGPRLGGCPAAAAEGPGRAGRELRPPAPGVQRCECAQPSPRPEPPRCVSRGAAAAALAFPAECHYYHSKGKGPAEGVAGGPTAPQHGRRARARAAGGRSAVAQELAWPAPAQGHSGDCAWREQTPKLQGRVGGRGGGGSVDGSRRADPLPQFSPRQRSRRWKGGRLAPLTDPGESLQPGASRPRGLPHRPAPPRPSFGKGKRLPKPRRRNSPSCSHIIPSQTLPHHQLTPAAKSRTVAARCPGYTKTEREEN
ncbi:hypothetical protein AAY473_033944 [Plecturocebus cupreus]